MVGVTGFEPVTPCVSSKYSNQLSYTPIKIGINTFKLNLELVNKIPNIKYDFYGFANKQPIWGNDFNNALINSKMGLNLSRGKPTKYYSSNRIASIMGNGLLTFIDEKVQMSDFFNKNEIIFYNNIKTDFLYYYNILCDITFSKAVKSHMGYLTALLRVYFSLPSGVLLCLWW